MATREQAAEAYVRMLRTGEETATRFVTDFLAPDVVFAGGPAEVTGREAVLTAVSGIWPNTAVYVQGFFSAPKPSGDQLKVDAKFPPYGASPAELHLTFSFNGSNQISRVDQQIVPQTPPTPVNEIPDVVRGMINGALANGTPMTTAYVDEDGVAHLSLRGSTQVYSKDQLSIWVRSAKGGICDAVAKNPNVTFLYRDSKTRSTLMIQGRAHVDNDPAVRKWVFEMSPEVEQNHDPGMVKGAALIIDVDKIQGGTVYESVRFARNAS